MRLRRKPRSYFDRLGPDILNAEPQVLIEMADAWADPNPTRGCVRTLELVQRELALRRSGITKRGPLVTRLPRLMPRARVGLEEAMTTLSLGEFANTIRPPVAALVGTVHSNTQRDLESAARVIVALSKRREAWQKRLFQDLV